MRIALVLALVACSDSDPTAAAHEIVDCPDSFGLPPSIKCENACTTEGAETGSTCMEASSPNQGATFTCVRTFEARGLLGCCVEANDLVTFFECP